MLKSNDVSEWVLEFIPEQINSLFITWFISTATVIVTSLTLVTPQPSPFPDKAFILEDVLYVPAIQKNGLSVAKFTKEKTLSFLKT